MNLLLQVEGLQECFLILLYCFHVLKKNASNKRTFVSDGHAMDSVEDNFFSNIVCFDSSHHMYDFERTFRELFRVLVPGGRAVFVEPGSKHSTSKEL